MKIVHELREPTRAGDNSVTVRLIVDPEALRQLAADVAFVANALRLERLGLGVPNGTNTLQAIAERWSQPKE